jgi:hypothetical protein
MGEKIQVSGEIIDVESVLVGAKQTPKTTLVVADKSEYSDGLPVVFFGKSADYVSAAEKGDVLECEAEVRGRCWQPEGPNGPHRWFLELSGWKASITKAVAAGGESGAGEPAYAGATGPTVAELGGDLPF